MAMKKQDAKIIVRLVADILYAFGFFLIVPMIIGLFNAEYMQAATFAIGAVLLVSALFILRRNITAAGVKRHHGAIAIGLTWICLSLLSSVPFLVDGMSWIDALFESFSAWTDTGLTMIPHPGELPISLSLFRVLMQWISGLGIVMFLLSFRGPSPRSAHRLFEAEGRFEDFSTNIWQVGRTIVLIYSGYTFAGFLLFMVLGIPPFHALTHAISSLSTGGFSTNSVGVGLYGALPSLVAMFLMLFGGISFSSHQALTSGNLKKFFNNPEIKALIIIIAGASGLLLFENYLADRDIWERALETFFYVVSAISTCGAGTTLLLSEVPDMFVFTIIFLMASGAVYGSTTGAIKLWRLLILGQVLRREIKRPFYPTGTVMPIRMGHNLIAEETILQVAMYTLLYIAIGMVGSLVFMLFGHRSLYSLFTVFSAQGNVGLNAMPGTMFYNLHIILKIQLIIHMLIGRMEIFPLLYFVRGLRE